MMSLVPESENNLYVNTDVNINIFNIIFTHYEIISVLTLSLFLGNILHEQQYYQLTYSMNILFFLHRAVIRLHPLQLVTDPSRIVSWPVLVKSSGVCVLDKDGASLCVFSSGEHGVCLCVLCSLCSVSAELIQSSVVVRGCLRLRRYVCPSCVRRMYDRSVSAGWMMTAGFQRPCSWTLTYSPLCSGGNGLDDVS